MDAFCTLLWNPKDPEFWLLELLQNPNVPEFFLGFSPAQNFSAPLRSAPKFSSRHLPCALPFIPFRELAYSFSKQFWHVLPRRFRHWQFAIVTGKSPLINAFWLSPLKGFGFGLKLEFQYPPCCCPFPKPKPFPLNCGWDVMDPICWFPYIAFAWFVDWPKILLEPSGLNPCLPKESANMLVGGLLGPVWLDGIVVKMLFALAFSLILFWWFWADIDPWFGFVGWGLTKGWFLVKLVHMDSWS